MFRVPIAWAGSSFARRRGSGKGSEAGARKLFEYGLGASAALPPMSLSAYDVEAERQLFDLTNPGRAPRQEWAPLQIDDGLNASRRGAHATAIGRAANSFHTSSPESPSLAPPAGGPNCALHLDQAGENVAYGGQRGSGAAELDALATASFQKTC